MGGGMNKSHATKWAKEVMYLSEKYLTSGNEDIGLQSSSEDGIGGSDSVSILYAIATYASLSEEKEKKMRTLAERVG
ncbi:hypothetical protein FGB62_35g213 [Gracilaria domingensis]|nr:hypothetical protein FGB62_35g213 [Gracilaria domingensis]